MTCKVCNLPIRPLDMGSSGLGFGEPTCMWRGNHPTINHPTIHDLPSPEPSWVKDIRELTKAVQELVAAIKETI